MIFHCKGYYEEIKPLRNLYKPGDSPKSSGPTLSDLKEVGKGVLQEVQGTIESVLNPIQTAKNIGNVLLYPQQTWENYQKLRQQAWEDEYELTPKERAEKRQKDAMRMTGQLIGVVGTSVVIDKGLGKLSKLKKAKNLNKAPKPKKLNTVSKSSKVGNVAKKQPPKKLTTKPKRAPKQKKPTSKYHKASYKKLDKKELARRLNIHEKQIHSYLKKETLKIQIYM